MSTAAHLRPVLACVALVSLGGVAAALDTHYLSKAGYLCDPVVTHTNGMRLASSTPLRSHNVYWQCDPNRVGYCGGRYYTHCRNTLRGLGERCQGEFRPPHGEAPRATGNLAHRGVDGLEGGDSALLGALPSDPSVAPFAARQAAAEENAAESASAAGGAVWLDTLRTLGEKMTAAQGG